MDPYRDSLTVGICPRCGDSTQGDGEWNRLACRRGCGEWYPQGALARAFEWNEIIRGAGGYAPNGIRIAPVGWPWSAAACPVCRAEMQVGQRAELRFDHCAAHGVWLDAGEFARFVELFQRV
jgi:Zn-finger nucleic acid-binding protein